MFGVIYYIVETLGTFILKKQVKNIYFLKSIIQQVGFGQLIRLVKQFVLTIKIPLPSSKSMTSEVSATSPVSMAINTF